MGPITQLHPHCLQDFLLGTHPTFWNSSYNIVRWNRNTNTWTQVPWFNNNRKDAACGAWQLVQARLSGSSCAQVACSGEGPAMLVGTSSQAEQRAHTEVMSLQPANVENHLQALPTQQEGSPKAWGHCIPTHPGLSLAPSPAPLKRS
jgi:hypothetical protein